MTTVSMARPGHIVLGAVLVGAGAFTTFLLPPGLLGVLALLGLIRICWLEDNIISDLFGQERLPPGYRNTARMRRHLLLRWFGIWRDESPAEASAHLMATAMRTEVQAWGSFLLGLAATLVAQNGPFGLAINVGLGAAIFLTALARADRLTVSLAHCEAGKALPDALLLPRARRGMADRGGR